MLSILFLVEHTQPLPQDVSLASWAGQGGFSRHSPGAKDEVLGTSYSILRQDAAEICPQGARAQNREITIFGDDQGPVMIIF